MLREIFKNGRLCYKKNLGTILILSFVVSIIFSGVYSVLGAYLSPFFSTIILLLLFSLIILSIKFICYKFVLNKNFNYKDFYFGFHNKSSAFKLSSASYTQGLLHGALYYFASTIILVFVFMFYMYLKDTSTIVNILNLAKENSIDEALAEIDKIPYLDGMLTSISIVSILAFAYAFIKKGLRRVHVFYATLEYPIIMGFAIGICDNYVQFEGKKNSNIINYVGIMPIFILLILSFLIDEVLLNLGMANLLISFIVSLMFFFISTLLIFNYELNVTHDYIFNIKWRVENIYKEQSQKTVEIKD